MSSWLLERLGVDRPVFAAPMAGGPTTTGLVRAAAAAGGLGFLAAGYQTPAALAADIGSLARSSTPFGVNLFVPNPVPVDPAAYRRYAVAIAAEAARYGVVLPGETPIEDDDHWAAKIDVLRTNPVPMVSFTFGLPGAADLAALRATGALLVQTVTSVEEARAAVDAGLDVVALQGSAAGGHYGTWSPGAAPWSSSRWSISCSRSGRPWRCRSSRRAVWPPLPTWRPS